VGRGARTYTRNVRVVASDEARRYVAERGGRLYVWLASSGCCHSIPRLECATQARTDRNFRRVSDHGFEVWAPARIGRLPSELHVEVRRFPRRRVEAYWDGCAWVV
jgi:hypothetical protein